MATLIDLPTYDDEEPEGFAWNGVIPGTDRKAATAVERLLRQISNEIRNAEAANKSRNYVDGLRRALNIFAERIEIK